MSQVLEKLAKLCAIAGGLVLTAIMLMTAISVAGTALRHFGTNPIIGDLELTAAGCGAAISLFLPWSQFKRGNIIVDFFTSRLNPATNNRLDRLGALLLAIVMGLLTWRAAIGLINAKNAGSGSMMLGFPDWIVYCFICTGFALTCLIALYQSVSGFDAGSENSN